MIPQTKTAIRQYVWKTMSDAKVVGFPGANGRIPNFIGASTACTGACNLDVWLNAKTIKANPDLPQRPLRKQALLEGKVVYMAVPRLRDEKCFVELDPEQIGDPHFASSIKGAFQVGKLIYPEEMPRIDLIVCGSVAVRPDGARLGKGGGYSDLEYALAKHFGVITSETPVLTTVHSLQVVDIFIPMTNHDIPVDFICTPHKVIACPHVYPKPKQIYPEDLGEKMFQIPILEKFFSI